MNVTEVEKEEKKLPVTPPHPGPLRRARFKADLKQYGAMSPAARAQLHILAAFNEEGIEYVPESILKDIHKDVIVAAQVIRDMNQQAAAAAAAYQQQKDASQEG